MLSDKNILAEELIALLTDALVGRISLEEHGTKLIDRMAATYPSIRKQIVLSDNNILTEELAALLTL